MFSCGYAGGYAARTLRLHYIRGDEPTDHSGCLRGFMKSTRSYKIFARAASLLILCAGALHAQSITGTVQSASGAVPGVTLRLLELQRLVRSGAGGRFTFTDVPKGTYRLFAAAEGFASQTDTVQVTGDVATVSITLRESPMRLEDVVVSAAPHAGLTTEQYQSTATKTRTELLTSPGTTFAEKISDLPGVAVRGLGSAPDRPILRGLGDNEVLVLENGLRMGDLATFDPAHATPIDALSISRVEVVRGPATILYGPSTIGGIVNVITDIVPELSDRNVSGTAIAEGSTGADQVSGYFNNVFGNDHQAFKVSAGGVHGNDIRIPSRTYIDPAPVHSSISTARRSHSTAIGKQARVTHISRPSDRSV